MARPPVDFSVHQEGLQSLTRALKEHEDGKKLRRELAKNMRAALQPAVAEVKAGLMSIGHSGLPTEGEPLRAGVAKKIRAEARLSGRATGARVKARRTQNLREFKHAPKRLNARKGWRRRVFGKNIWVVQMGNPGYFDDPLNDRKSQYRKAVLQVMEDMAKKIAQKGA